MKQITALAGLLAGLVAVGAVASAQAQDGDRGRDRGRDRRGEQRRPVEATPVLAWSAASSRPNIRAGQYTGFYIWHDRNTVHVVSTDRTRQGDMFRGMIEIQKGRFDTLKNENTQAGDRFNQVADNRITFRFDTGREKDGFRFNLHGGDRIVFHITKDNRKTSRIYYGSSQTEAGGDPVIFDLHR